MVVKGGLEIVCFFDGPSSAGVWDDLAVAVGAVVLPAVEVVVGMHSGFKATFFSAHCCCKAAHSVLHFELAFAILHA